MVEGHQCHRVAHAHRQLLLGKAFKASSPNGRFREGAVAIHGKPLTRIEVHGKNLFYFWGNTPPVLTPPAAPSTAAAVAPPTPVAATGAGPSFAAAPLVQEAAATAVAAGRAASKAAGRAGRAAAAVVTEASGKHRAEAADQVVPASTDDIIDPVVVHIHFGMSGAFRTTPLPGPAPTETTRLRLEHPDTGLCANLSAMTVQHGGLELYWKKVGLLGPDPLREDADVEALWQRVQRCKKPIGLVLMDQSMVAGIGNIYRAEILYKAGVHPEQPAYTVDRSMFDRIWAHSVTLLQRGFVSGSILTVDPEDAQVLGKPWTRRYIYNHRHCGRCKAPVRSWDMAGRTAYACETCQPLISGTVLPQERAVQLAAAAHAKEFVSHCAPDDPDDACLAKWTCAALRCRLQELNLDTRGNKAQLVERLQAALQWVAGGSAAAPAADGETGTGAVKSSSRAAGSGAAALEGEATAATEPGAADEVVAAAADGSEVVLLTPSSAPRRRRAAARSLPPLSPPKQQQQQQGLSAPSEGQAPLATGGSSSRSKAQNGSSSGSRKAQTGGGSSSKSRKRPRLQLPVEDEELGGDSDLDSGSADELDLAEELLSRQLGVDPAIRPPSTAAAAGKEGLVGPTTPAAARDQPAGAAGGSPGSTPTPFSAAEAGAGAAGREPPLPLQVQPGTVALLGQVVSAREAAAEKLAAGENRAVEHVALADEETDALVAAAAGKGAAKRGPPARRS